MYLQHILQAATCLLLAGLGASAPSGAWLDPRSLFVAAAPELEPRVYTADEIHNNILARWPADRVVEEAAHLPRYLADHADEAAGTAVYVRDTRTFVEVPVAGRNSSSLSAREECSNEPNTYTLIASMSFFDPWEPLTDCLMSDKDPAGGSGSVQFSWTKGSTTDLGVDLTVVKDILGGSLGFSIETQYTVSVQYSCNAAPPQNVAQVWGRHRMGWARVQTESCNACEGCKLSYGYALMPSTSSQDSQYGCSAGYNNVICQSS